MSTIPFTTYSNTGLLAEWKFQNSIKDSSGNHHTGVQSGNPHFAHGKAGKSLKFDGVDDVVTIKNSPSLNFGANKSFSISLWLKSTQTGTGDAAFGWLVDHRRNNDGIYAGSTIGDYAGTIEARIRDQSSHDVLVTSKTNVNDGKWHQIVFVVNRASQVEKLYVDNILQNSSSISGVGNINTNFDLHLGGTAYPNTPLDFYHGVLDQVLIHDHALSKGELSYLYDSSITN